jgi:hypothetical protein
LRGTAANLFATLTRKTITTATSLTWRVGASWAITEESPILLRSLRFRVSTDSESVGNRETFIASSVEQAQNLAWCKSTLWERNWCDTDRGEADSGLNSQLTPNLIH